MTTLILLTCYFNFWSRTPSLLLREKGMLLTTNQCKNSFAFMLFFEPIFSSPTFNFTHAKCMYDLHLFTDFFLITI